MDFTAGIYLIYKLHTGIRKRVATDKDKTKDAKPHYRDFRVGGVQHKTFPGIQLLAFTFSANCQLPTIF